MDKLELLVSLLIVAIGGFIMGAACVAIQLEKVKRQRDEALEEPMEKEIAAWFDDLDVWLMDNEEHKYTSILQLLLDLRSGKFIESDEWVSLKDKDNDK